MASSHWDAFQSQSTRQIALFGILIVTSVTFIIYELVRWNSRIPKFSGPVGLPIVGNLWQLRGKDIPEQYRVWSRKYGAVYQVQLGSIPVLVINSAAAAKAILIQNSQATASRPEFYTFHKIIASTSGTTLGTTPYTNSLRKRRKVVSAALNRPAVESYIPHLDIETRFFLAEALKYGQSGGRAIDPMPLFLRLNLSLGLTLHWGDRMGSQSEVFQEIVYVEDLISNFRSTTGNLQDYVPLLRLNPFNSSSAIAADMRTRRDKYIAALDRALDEKMKKGEHKPCIRANVKLDQETKLDEMELGSLNLTMLTAGLDTMNGAVGWGIAMLATMPEIQKKAQEAIMSTYGDDAPLCDAYDRQSCDYLFMMIKEIVRYYAVTRLALPRRSIADFTYEGKLVPKGTILFLNAWACNMDPAVWDDPEVFRPERWREQPDAPLFTFGVGHRMCIGTQLAYRELYLLFLRLLNSYEIRPQGPIESHPIRGVANRNSLVMLPKSYKVRFIPRNENALQNALVEELGQVVLDGKV
ncbi:3-hydroxyphenylacetate 6-hydroxylase [Cladophialophora psammophila CBS 110553]|uniref:3-hydroxyphenylacetate 6-hydroxylase n=1 Tax=Cladophialophora psammophila CBS 110553 TaxID=1182543 RepID=W9VQR6_9EURO|nr:3-hydroxyphenylacetate 6-hydroxylase [Cladophialophora psammophila CBS 110553]EXJ57878.1 3-hydroxyphenylacetate 6-hydroxylase [Cladophialophora psammophila CBS 110553]